MSDEDLDPLTAKRESEARLFQVEARWPSIRDIVEPLFRARQENHFAERLRAAMEPRDRKA